jgi:hypothetical protein
MNLQLYQVHFPGGQPVRLHHIVAMALVLIAVAITGLILFSDIN